MKIAIALVAAAGILVPASPALADTPAPVAVVARWDFNAGSAAGKIVDTSGKGVTLSVRSADQGVLRFEAGTVIFPAGCAAAATTCARGLMEAPDNANLNPGTRLFNWSARVNVTKAQLSGSANIMQKGVAGTGSQWKLQLGATNGRAQCVVTGTGSATPYIARSDISVTDGQWHKLYCQRSGTTLSVQIDGAVHGSTTIPATLSISNTSPLRVGGANFNLRSDMYHGTLDDVYAELG
ncbi:laminin G domain-containing protein [Actinoplanes sp. NPDC026619]|uniref:laminin G domain-containing protein n=1 Tax=Actinoplanes sp. NPDC026619 TaxID=3155798 RepID=UPI0033E0C1A0